MRPDHLHLGDDLGEPTAVGHPLLVDARLPLIEPARDGLARGVASPLPVGAVGTRRVGMTATPGSLTGGVATDHRALLDEAELEDLAG